VEDGGAKRRGRRGRKVRTKDDRRLLYPVLPGPYRPQGKEGRRKGRAMVGTKIERRLLSSVLTTLRDSFGKIALNTLVDMMEIYRNDLVVIMAGYPKEMAGLMAVNPGLPYVRGREEEGGGRRQEAGRRSTGKAWW
jgi:hypothetical protein